MASWNVSSWAALPSSVVVPASLQKRIFVLSSLPRRFNAAVDLPIAMKHGVYLKAERIVHELLLASRARAHTVSLAHRYFVPLYVGMLGKKQSRLAELDAAFEALHRLVPHLWPSCSAQFVFVVSLDRGRCFQDDGVDRFRDATVLMHDGTAGYPRAPGGDHAKPTLSFPCYRRGRDVAIPPATDLGLHTALVVGAPELGAPSRARHPNSTFPWSFFTRRKLLAVWRGSSSRSAWAGGGGDRTSLDVRPALLATFGGRKNASAVRAALGAGASSQAPVSQMPSLVSTRKVDKAAHYLEMRKALFCLAPSGWAQWTVRFFEAVHLGCVPVTFEPRAANGAPASMGRLRMPFDDRVNYSAFVVNIEPRDVASRLRPVLEEIAADRLRLRAMQRALWAARPAFDWTDGSSEGAFYRSLEQLVVVGTGQETTVLRE